MRNGKINMGCKTNAHISSNKLFYASIWIPIVLLGKGEVKDQVMGENKISCENCGSIYTFIKIKVIA